MIFEKKTTGFAGINIGNIMDSYSKVHMINQESAGFCIRNTGSICRCFYDPGKRTSIRNGFCSNTAKLESCFYLKCKMNQQDAMDINLELDQNSVCVFINENAWDTDNVWIWNGNGLDLRDQKDVVNDRNDKYDYIIYSEEDLRKFVDGVNYGNPQFSEGSILLDRDIVLKNPQWTPIGSSERYPFMGKFDGRGHQITGFLTESKHTDFPGFFGICKNASVRDLSVLGRIVSSVPAAGFINICNDSEVTNCSVTIQMKSKDSGCGFVYKNAGEIKYCKANGTIRQQIFMTIG